MFQLIAIAGLLLIAIISMALLIFIAWQLLVLRKKVSRLYYITEKLYARAKSHKINREIGTVANRLSGIESEISRIISEMSGGSGDGPVNDNDGAGITDGTIKDPDGPGVDPPGDPPLSFADRSGSGTGDYHIGTRVPDSRPGIFYMPSPDNDGNFDNRKKSDHFIPSESIYKFETDGNSRENARFFIYQDPNNMERAINYYSSILEKVCRGENAFNPLGKTIKTIEPGHAVLTNDKWVVKEKALVRYE